MQVVQEETPRYRWECRGRSAGMAASLNAVHGRVVVTTPPTAEKATMLWTSDAHSGFGFDRLKYT